jgi:hypothetical protein
LATELGCGGATAVGGRSPSGQGERPLAVQPEQATLVVDEIGGQHQGDAGVARGTDRAEQANRLAAQVAGDLGDQRLGFF